jgi:hypothetical protein
MQPRWRVVDEQVHRAVRYTRRPDERSYLLGVSQVCDVRERPGKLLRSLPNPLRCGRDRDASTKLREQPSARKADSVPTTAAAHKHVPAVQPERGAHADSVRVSRKPSPAMDGDNGSSP